MGWIAVRDLGKLYKIYPHRRGRLVEWLTWNRYVAHYADWVLRGISFEVREGESVGIIGMNGAGKSTLLRILAGTTLPTEGRFELGGRVAALLELGLGIHPEFSGSQNAILACQLMGLPDALIEECLPRIRDFSELDDHMERPVRTYSTGMQLRLAFSVATVVRPDILIIDEALSVGDAYFQHKSMSRIRSLKEQGTTLLLVTHDPAALKLLCDRALLLDRGTLLRDGSPEAVFNYYNAMIARKEQDAEIQQIQEGRSGAATRSGNKRAEILSVELSDLSGQARRSFAIGDTARIVCRARVNEDMESPTIGFLIRDRLGADVFGSNTHYLETPNWKCAADDDLTASFDVQLNVGQGSYSLTVALHSRETHLEQNFDWWDQALLFEVIPDRSPRFSGIAALPAKAVVRRARRDA